MRDRSALFIVALCARALGQTASVEGVVTNSLTGAPLAHVHVILRDPSKSDGVQYGAETRPEGNFSISGIKPGSYIVSGERVGFVMPRGVGSRLSVTLAANDKTGDLQLKLTPGGAIIGHVTDAEGDPVERAIVSAEGIVWRQAATDEQGQFRIGGLPPGKYRVKASHGSSLYRMFFVRPEIRADGTTEVYNATTYYPGVLESKQAGKVEVRPGSDSAGVDVQLAGVPFVRVSGKVVGMPRGAPEPYVTISSHDMGGYGDPVRPDGSFEFWGLDPGHYRLIADWGAPGGQETIRGPRTSTAVIEIEVADSNVDNIELRVMPDSELAGRLELNAQEIPQPDLKRMVILSQVSTGSRFVPPARVDAGDTFRLEKVPAGKYVVGLSWDSAYVKSMRLGATPIDGAILDLSNGSGGADLVLLLAAATGSVSGTVRGDRDNPAEARVALLPDGENPGFVPRYAKAKQGGAYSFANLPPGGYKLVAVPEDDADLIMLPSGLTEYEDLMDTVAIQDGDKVTMDLSRRTTGEK